MKTSTWVALGAALAAALLVAGAVLAALCVGRPWWDAAVWIEALATVVAFVAAIVAANYVRHTVDLEQRREDRYLEDRQREQAMKVAAWVRHGPTTVQTDWKVILHSVTLRLQNSSDLPVYDVQAHFRNKVSTTVGDGEHAEDHRLALLPPGSHDVPFGQVAIQLPIQPTQASQQDREHLRTSMSHVHPVSITFRDTAGIVWCRESDGVLAQVTAGDAAATS